jgi:hypothetical protein
MTLVIKPKKSGASSFLKVYHEAFAAATHTSRSDPERLYFLRCSQLPYCPSSVLFRFAQQGMTFTMDMGMAYYVSVGTAVHEVLQKYLASSGTFLANYTCLECGEIHFLSHVYECCGFPTKYDEVDINYKGVKGHIDGIFKDAQDRYWIIDFKTTSLSASKLKTTKPGVGYVRQVEAYSLLLYKQYKIKVAGMMLVFIPRDNPRLPVIWEQLFTKKIYNKALAEIKADLRLHRLTLKAKTLDDIKPLLKVNCGNPYCEACAMTYSAKVKLAKRLLPKFPIRKN